MYAVSLLACWDLACELNDIIYIVAYKADASPCAAVVLWHTGTELAT